MADQSPYPPSEGQPPYRPPDQPPYPSAAGQPPPGQPPYPPAGQLPPPYPPPGRLPPPMPHPVQPRKEPLLSLLISFLVPGVGSMINGDVSAGVGILVGYGLSIVFMVCFSWFFFIGFLALPVMLGFWGYGMYDAYQGAVRANQRAGYPF